MGWLKKYYRKLVPKEIDPIRNYVYPEMIEPGIEGITNDMAATRGDALRAELNRVTGPPLPITLLHSGFFPLSSTGSTGGGVPVSMIIPPGGFAGAAQQSAANRHTMAKANGRKGGKRSAARRSSARKKSAAKRAPKSRRKPRTKATKGSAAMKRKMAKLRKMRKK